MPTVFVVATDCHLFVANSVKHCTEQPVSDMKVRFGKGFSGATISRKTKSCAKSDWYASVSGSSSYVGPEAFTCRVG